jgi:hypothetical protein
MKKLEAIGFWRSEENRLAWPHPREVRGNWSQVEREQIAMYLEQGILINEQMGVGIPRFKEDLEKNLGCGDRTDGVWVWPQSLPHYVRNHGVFLPDSFVEHVRMNSFSIPETISSETMQTYNYSFSVWNTWCRHNRSNRILAYLSWLLYPIAKRCCF